MECDLHFLLIDCAQKSVASVASVERVVSLPFLHLHAGYKWVQTHNLYYKRV